MWRWLLQNRRHLTIKLSEFRVPVFDKCIWDYWCKILKSERSTIKKKWDDNGCGNKMQPPLGVTHAQLASLVKYWLLEDATNKSEQLFIAQSNVKNLSHARRGGNAKLVCCLLFPLWLDFYSESCDSFWEIIMCITMAECGHFTWGECQWRCDKKNPSSKIPLNSLFVHEFWNGFPYFSFELYTRLSPT